MPNASAASWARISAADHARARGARRGLRVVRPGPTRRRRRPRCGRPRRAAPRRRRRSSRSPRRGRRAGADAGANGLTLTTTMSIRPMPCSRELVELVRDVAAGEDARVDRGWKVLTWPPTCGRAGQVGDRTDLDAVCGEVLAGAVGGVDLDVEREQVAGEARRCPRGRRPTAGLAPGSSSTSWAVCRPSAAGALCPDGRGGAALCRPSIPRGRGILRRGRIPAVRGDRVTLLPWEYFDRSTRSTSRTCSTRSGSRLRLL